MSERNGDRARFQKNRKRKLHHRQRIRALMARLGTKTDRSQPAGQAVTAASADTGSVARPGVHDDGGSMRTRD